MAATSQMQLTSVQEPSPNIKQKIKGIVWQYEQLKAKAPVRSTLPPPSNNDVLEKIRRKTFKARIRFFSKCDLNQWLAYKKKKIRKPRKVTVAAFSNTSEPNEERGLLIWNSCILICCIYQFPTTIRRNKLLTFYIWIHFNTSSIEIEVNINAPTKFTRKMTAR